MHRLGSYYGPRCDYVSLSSIHPRVLFKKLFPKKYHEESELKLESL